MNNDGDHEPGVLLDPNGPEPSILPRKLLRQACVDADISEQTATRILAGYPTRGGTRDRLVAALTRLGVSPGAVPPAPARAATGRLDLSAANVATAKGSDHDSGDDDAA